MNETIAEHYVKNFDSLVKKLSYRAGTQWDAEDAIHDAYERALKYFPSFNPDKGPFALWFSRLLSNALKDHYNANLGRTGSNLEFDEELAEGTPCEHYPRKMKEEIERRIDGRRPHISEILQLYFVNGYSARDISRMVESSHVAVNQTIFRFREELRKDYK
jgi:RNA polymerase sigma factor (sigma-70 family)